MTDPHSGAVIEVPEDLADRFSEAGYRPGAKRSRRSRPAVDGTPVDSPGEGTGGDEPEV